MFNDRPNLKELNAVFISTPPFNLTVLAVRSHLSIVLSFSDNSCFPYGNGGNFTSPSRILLGGMFMPLLYGGAGN